MKTFGDWASEDVCVRSLGRRASPVPLLRRIGWAFGSLTLAIACAAPPCETPVAGTPEDWRHQGQFEGYRVEAGCDESPVVVAGTGEKWLDEAPPSDRSRKRLAAVAGFHSRYLEKHQKEISSWNGYSQGQTCLGEGAFGVVVLQDWRDVDRTVRIVGEALASANLRERVGIQLAPFTCSEATGERVK